MALSMDEQHILDEIEERLARSEPALAARLSSFGRPAVAARRAPRAFVMASFATLVVMAFASLMLYALVPLRAMPGRGLGTRAASSPAHPALSPQGAAGSGAVPAPPVVSRGAFPTLTG